MVIQLTGKIGSVWCDKGEDNKWYGHYDVTVWWQSHRYIKRVEFDNIWNHNDIVWQDEPVSIEFNTETFEITIL